MSAAPALISAALFGAGRRGLQTHVSAIAANPCLELALVVDLESELQRVRSAVGQLRSANPGLAREKIRVCVDRGTGGNDWRTGPRPDIAIVATPHGSHVPLAYELLRQRVPILLEKPPAMTAAQLKDLKYASEDAGVPVATLMPARHLARFAPFRRALESARPGSEIEIRIDIPFYPGFGYWRTVREQAGGGVLFDLGYHILDLVLWHLGQPSTVEAFLARSPRLLISDGVDTAADVWLHFSAAEASVHAVLRASSELPPSFSTAVNGVALPIRSEQVGPLHPSVVATLTQVNQLLHDDFLAAKQSADLQHHIGVMELMEILYSSAQWAEADLGAAR